jgi:hypothetical protein
MRAKVTTHVLLGRKRLSCRFSVRSPVEAVAFEAVKFSPNGHLVAFGTDTGNIELRSVN